jgi:hypothetical protein
MDGETLDADFYRERACLCHELAEAATAARPLFVRLFFLGKAYEEKAKAADAATGQAIESSSRPTDLHHLL